MENSTRLRRLNQLITVLEAVPDEKFTIGNWMNTKHKDEEYKNGMPAIFKSVECTSAGCILGWAGLFKPFMKEGLITVPGTMRSHVEYRGYIASEAAEHFFGITFEEAMNLCSPNSYLHRPVLPIDGILKVKELINHYEYNGE